MDHFLSRIEVDGYHVNACLLSVNVIEAGYVQVLQALDGVASMPRVQALAEVETCEIAALTLSLGALEEALYALYATSTS